MTRDSAGVVRFRPTSDTIVRIQSGWTKPMFWAVTGRPVYAHQLKVGQVYLVDEDARTIVEASS